MQAAIRDGSGVPTVPALDSTATAPGFSARLRGNSTNGVLPVLAEGAEAALLYVRFRAAAEPSLKGTILCHTGAVNPAPHRPIENVPILEMSKKSFTIN